MSISPRNRRIPLVAFCLAAFAVLAAACSGTATIIPSEATSFDQAASQNEAAAQNSANTTTTGGTVDGSAQTAGLDDVEAAFDDLTEEEAELFLEAFEVAFNNTDTSTSTVDFDSDEPRPTVPEGGGPINASASVPYGACADGWVIFDLLTWDDAVAMLGIDPATHDQIVPVDSVDGYSDSYYPDGGAAFLDDGLSCGAQRISDGTLSLQLQMRATADVAYVNPDFTFDEEIQRSTTQTGQPLIVKLTNFNGPVERVDVILHWDWAGSPQGASQLVISVTNFSDGVTDQQIEGAINIAELISASADFVPPAFDSPLPSWYSCEGRNFVHSDVAEVAEAAGIVGPYELSPWVDQDWESASCSIAAPGNQDYAQGEFAVNALVFPAGSEEYERFVEDPSFDQATVGSITVAGRSMSTYSTGEHAAVVLDDGADKVVIWVLPQNGAADANATLATAIEITEIITR